VTPLALIFALALGPRAAFAADASGMLLDYAAAREKRDALHTEIERRIALFNRERGGLEDELDALEIRGGVLCREKTAAAEAVDRAAAALRSLQSDAAARLKSAHSVSAGACGAYAARAAHRELEFGRAYSTEAIKQLKDAGILFARVDELELALKEELAPWSAEKTAYLREQAASIGMLFTEALQRRDAERVSRDEIARLTGAAVPEPGPERDLDAWRRQAVDSPIARIDARLEAARCPRRPENTLEEIVGLGAAFDSRIDELVFVAGTCERTAGDALARDLADAPRVAGEIAAEELAYEAERKRHLARDLEDWKRRRAREARRIAQQRRFAETMRPPRRGIFPKGDGLKGPWLVWGAQSDADAPIRLRLTDVEAFDADGAPYKRLLRPRPFRDLKSAAAWVCERLADVRERPVLGHSAQYAEEIVSVSEEIRCE